LASISQETCPVRDPLSWVAGWLREEFFTMVFSAHRRDSRTADRALAGSRAAPLHAGALRHIEIPDRLRQSGDKILAAQDRVCKTGKEYAD